MVLSGVGFVFFNDCVVVVWENVVYVSGYWDWKLCVDFEVFY